MRLCYWVYVKVMAVTFVLVKIGVRFYGDGRNIGQVIGVI